jgi:CIC family chloride channel protein
MSQVAPSADERAPRSRAPRRQPIDVRFLGRTLLHALVVGGVMGVVGSALFAGIELAQRWLIEGIGGIDLMRAVGERFVGPDATRTIRPWLTILLPALGGLATGLLAVLAPEVLGGGGDAVIEAYHRGGKVRGRVAPLKALASVLALGSGGSGGREGPTMQIGGAVGAQLARWLPGTHRERRVLLLAGVAAGIAAVFRTPLGAALLAVEMPYRDDFESDALVPAILASVTSYGIVISIYGETTLFGPLPRFPFRPVELPLFAAMAVGAAVASVAFVAALDAVRSLVSRLPGPRWARPALGGLAMGAVATAVVLVLDARLGLPESGLGLFGGGYGLAQVSLTGSASLPVGWKLVGLLVLLLVAKMAVTALAAGSGMAVGDFAPSLVMGALVGEAFGQAAALLLPALHLQPAAFALVGMGTFFGGISRAPLSALVIVSELAGSYDLLVPMMLAGAISFVATRRWPLYPAQERRRIARGVSSP